MSKLIIFDADGTLTPQRQTSRSEPILELLPGVEAKCRELVRAGYLLAIASNQSAARPVADIRRQLAWTKQKIGALIYRYATTAQRRKPSPVMLLEVRRICNSRHVIFVGDQETDRQAAEEAGITFILAREFFSRNELPTQQFQRRRLRFNESQKRYHA